MVLSLVFFTDRVTSAAVLLSYCYYTMLLKKIQAFYKFFSLSKRYNFVIFVVYGALELCWTVLHVASHMH